VYNEITGQDTMRLHGSVSGRQVASRLSSVYFFIIPAGLLSRTGNLGVLPFPGSLGLHNALLVFFLSTRNKKTRIKFKRENLLLFLIFSNHQSMYDISMVRTAG